MSAHFSDIESDPSDYSDQECVIETQTESDDEACINSNFTKTRNQYERNRTFGTEISGINLLLTAAEIIQNENNNHKLEMNTITNSDSSHSHNERQDQCDSDLNPEINETETNKDSQADLDNSSIISSESKSPNQSTAKNNNKKKKRADWRKYYKRKTPILVLPCLICTEAFNAHTKWREHMNKTHNIERPYLCKRCLPENVCYANKAGLDAHILRDHEKVRNWKCEHCPKAFFRKETWSQHQRVHDGKRPYQCTECEMRFTQRNSLQDHIKTVHRKERNYVCSYCQKAFAAKTTLKSHLVARHNDAQYARFECDICHKRFYDGANYRKHRESGHRPMDPLKAMMKRGECFYEGCDKKYTSKNCIESLKYHLVHTHGDRRFAKYECKTCEKLFYEKKRYTEHMKETH